MNNDIKDLISGQIAEDQSLSFLLIGRTGVGKSSTINSLLGSEVAKVGRYQPTTVEVSQFKYDRDGIQFDIFDTPGLCDDLPEAGNDKHYLTLISEKVKEVDVVFFITELDATRVSSDEKRGIKIISNAFGSDIWEHAVIIFTRSDQVDIKDYEHALKVRTKLIKQEIAKYAKKQSKSIPSVAITNMSEKLPNGKEWLGELFTTTFEKMSEKGAFKFLVSMRRDIGITCDAESEQETRINIDAEQKERISRSGVDRMKGALTGATAGAAVGSMIPIIGTATGAAVGAIVGFFWD